MMDFMILTVAEWWAANTSLQQTLFIIAAAATLILVLQVIMLLIGMTHDASFDSALDAHDGVSDFGDADAFNSEGLVEVAGLRLVSFRTIIAFLSIGGWVAYLCLDYMNWYLAVPVGIVAGAMAGVGVAYAMRAMYRLQSSGNIDVNNAIGKVVDVYLTIPKNREGTGKVNIYVQESYIEREAVTNGDTIKTGEKALVIGVLNQSTVIVEKHSAK